VPWPDHAVGTKKVALDLRAARCAHHATHGSTALDRRLYHFQSCARFAINHLPLHRVVRQDDRSTAGKGADDGATHLAYVACFHSLPRLQAQAPRRTPAASGGIGGGTVVGGGGGGGGGGGPGGGGAADGGGSGVAGGSGAADGGGACGGGVASTGGVGGMVSHSRYFHCPSLVLVPLSCCAFCRFVTVVGARGTRAFGPTVSRLLVMSWCKSEYKSRYKMHVF
jgi:hypothetical protein